LSLNLNLEELRYTKVLKYGTCFIGLPVALLNTEASVKPKLKHPNVDAKKQLRGSNYSICELLVSSLEPDRQRRKAVAGDLCV
jgi:hypothetical protein